MSSKKPKGKKSDSWLSDSIEFGLRYLKVLGGSMQIITKSVEIRTNHIEVSYTSSKPDDWLTVNTEFASIMGFFHGFFVDKNFKDITNYKITIMAYNQTQPFLCVICNWEDVKSAGEGKPWEWLLSSRFKKILTEDMQIRTNLTLYKFENSFRDFVKTNLKGSYGYLWKEKGIPKKLIRKIKENSANPQQFDVRAGAGGILRHLDFTDLRTMVNVNWNNVFESRIPDKDEFNRDYAFLEPIRVALAHNHPLSEEEINKFEVLTKKLLGVIRES